MKHNALLIPEYEYGVADDERLAYSAGRPNQMAQWFHATTRQKKLRDSGKSHNRTAVS
jgi:hypothetical protein